MINHILYEVDMPYVPEITGRADQLFT